MTAAWKAYSISKASQLEILFLCAHMHAAPLLHAVLLAFCCHPTLISLLPLAQCVILTTVTGMDVVLPFDILNMLFHTVLYVNGSMYVCTYASICKSNPINLIMMHT